MPLSTRIAAAPRRPKLDWIEATWEPNSKDLFGRPNPRAPGLFPGSLVHGTFFLRLGFWTIWTSLPMEIYHTVLRGFGWVSGPVSLGRENILVG
jgi:hypothetical protein